MKIDLLGGSYEQKYNDLNSQRTINWYNVPSTPLEKSKEQNALFPFFGLKQYVSLPGRYIRSLYTARTTAGTRCFAILDTDLYEIMPNQDYEYRGALEGMTSGSTTVYMTANYNNQLGIFHKSGGWYLDMDTNLLTHITTNQFIGDVDYTCYTDGYTLIASEGSVFFNENADYASWDITNTFTPSWTAAPTIAVGTLLERVYCFTTKSIEIYGNDNTTPFSRLPQSTVAVGIVAKNSLQAFNEGFIFLGRAGGSNDDYDGQAAVYFFDKNVVCDPISPFSINWEINSTNSNLEDCYSYMQNTEDGHMFYYLTIPSLNRTYVYDVISKQWQERSSQEPFQQIDGSYNRPQFRGRHYTCFNGKHLFSDMYSGKIFIEDAKTTTEDYLPIIRTRISQTYSQDYQNISVSMLEIDCNTGSAPVTYSAPIMQLYYSKDGGYNYFNPRNLNLGTTGNHIYRSRLHKLGTARNWVMKMVLSEPIDLMIQGAVARGSIGSI